MKLIEFATDIVANSPDATIISADAVISFFKRLHDQRAELQALKIATMAHIWAREQNGKLEIVALDDDFGAIQQQIATLETVISHNEAVTEELDKYYRDEKMESTAFGPLEKRRATIASDIRGRQKRLAGAPDSAQAKKQQEINALEAEAKEISAKIDGVRAILEKA